MVSISNTIDEFKYIFENSLGNKCIKYYLTNFINYYTTVHPDLKDLDNVYFEPGIIIDENGTVKFIISYFEDNCDTYGNRHEIPLDLMYGGYSEENIDKYCNKIELEYEIKRAEKEAYNMNQKLKDEAEYKEYLRLVEKFRHSG